MEPFLLILALVLFRSAAFVGFLPAPLGRNLPVTVRIGLACALAWNASGTVDASAAGLLWARVDRPAGGLMITWLVARETAIGAALAWLVGLVLVPARLAGAYLSEEIGLSNAALASPVDQQSSNILSHAIELFMLVLLLGANVHYLWIWSLWCSFVAWPAGGRGSPVGMDMFLDRLSRADQLGIMSIGPVAVAMFLILVCLLAISRTAPQLNLFSFGMPVRSLAGCCLLLLFLPEILMSLLRSAELLSSLSGFE